MTSTPHLTLELVALRALSGDLAEAAVWALIAEAELTPKPALVDRRGSGAHRDMNLALLRRSAIALQPTFFALSHAANGVAPSPALREHLGAIGRQGEAHMMQATAGCNTHRGAIWTLGLLCAAASSLALAERTSSTICYRAAHIASLPDGSAPGPNSQQASHGAAALARYGVRGARGEAAAGFPHVLRRALPVLRSTRATGGHEDSARLNALLAIMATLDDTCLLHRGGPLALHTAQRGAQRALQAGGAATTAGMRSLLDLDSELLALNSSPGGSADLLAAALFLDRITGGN